MNHHSCLPAKMYLEDILTRNLTLVNIIWGKSPQGVLILNKKREVKIDLTQFYIFISLKLAYFYLTNQDEHRSETKQ